jgi:hypothetical protein
MDQSKEIQPQKGAKKTQKFEAIEKETHPFIYFLGPS